MKLIEKDDILLFVIILLQIFYLVKMKLSEADISVWWYIGLGICVFFLVLRIILAVIYNLKNRKIVEDVEDNGNE